jgi:hypothetical protein
MACGCSCSACVGQHCLRWGTSTFRGTSCTSGYCAQLSKQMQLPCADTLRREELPAVRPPCEPLFPTRSQHVSQVTPMGRIDKAAEPASPYDSVQHALLWLPPAPSAPPAAKRGDDARTHHKGTPRGRTKSKERY